MILLGCQIFTLISLGIARHMVDGNELSLAI